MTNAANLMKAIKDTLRASKFAQAMPNNFIVPPPNSGVNYPTPSHPGGTAANFQIPSHPPYSKGAASNFQTPSHIGGGFSHPGGTAANFQMPSHSPYSEGAAGNFRTSSYPVCAGGVVGTFQTPPHPGSSFANFQTPPHFPCAGYPPYRGSTAANFQTPTHRQPPSSGGAANNLHSPLYPPACYPGVGLGKLC